MKQKVPHVFNLKKNYIPEKVIKVDILKHNSSPGNKIKMLCKTGGDHLI